MSNLLILGILLKGIQTIWQKYFRMVGIVLYNKSIKDG